MALGVRMARLLLFLHAFSGCDTVSFFSGSGKKTAWKTGCHSMRAMRRIWHSSMIHRSSLMNALPCWEDFLPFSMTEQVIKMSYVE